VHGANVRSLLAPLALVSSRRVRATALRRSCLLSALLALAPTTVATQKPDALHPTRAQLREQARTALGDRFDIRDVTIACSRTAASRFPCCGEIERWIDQEFANR
jgi:hypothetical protein